MSHENLFTIILLDFLHTCVAVAFFILQEPAPLCFRLRMRERGAKDRTTPLCFAPGFAFAADVCTDPAELLDPVAGMVLLGFLRSCTQGPHWQGMALNLDLQ